MTRRLLVLTIDGLRADALGAYGNSAYGTPAFDRLAAEGLVCDWVFCPTPEQPHRLFASLGPAAAECEAIAMLVTDDDQLAMAATGYQETVPVTHADIDRPAADVGATQCAELLERAANQLALHAGQPILLHTHHRGFAGDWDAPIELAASLIDDEESPPQSITSPPMLKFDDRAEVEDALLEATARYGGQVMAIDAALGGLLAWLRQQAAEVACDVIVAGTRGFPLGEWSQVGGTDRGLPSAQLHVPLIIWKRSNDVRLARHAGLFAIDQLASFIQAALAGEPLSSLSGLPRLHAESSSHHSLRTADWYFVEPIGSEYRGAKLFVKPDDRYDANDVAGRCPEEMEQMREQLEHQLPTVSPPSREAFET